MANFDENTHIEFLLGGNWGFKVVKMSVSDHKILKYVAKKRKGARLQPFRSIFTAVLPANTASMI